jgi:hypothetical protein
VDGAGEKFTCVAEAEHFKELLANGEAPDPDGIRLATTAAMRDTRPPRATESVLMPRWIDAHG